MGFSNCGVFLVSPDSCTLNKATTSIEVGANETLTVTVLPANAANKSVTWESSDTSVATVNSSGKVVGVGVGTATITATTFNGMVGSCVVTITSA